MTPAPPAIERDSAPWWAALAEHHLTCGRCRDCGTWRWPMRGMCGRCGSLDGALEPVSGRATVASWVVNRHAFGGAVAVPSTVVLARLVEQPDLLIPAGFAGPSDGAGLAVGRPLNATFVDHRPDDGSEPFTLLAWETA